MTFHVVFMLAVFSALFAFFLLAERRFSSNPNQPLLRRGLRADLVYAPLNVVLRIVFNGTVAVAFAEVGRSLLPPGLVGMMSGSPLWAQTLVLLVVLDVAFYVMHRLKHRWNWWWRLHETHHSSVDLDFFSSVRFHPLEKILDRTVFLLPVFLLGPSESAVLIWACTDAFFGLFIHSNVRWRLGILKYVFVGPEMHRWHHVRNPEIRECNYGNNFSFCDWIFGTAYVADTQPNDFGVDDPDYPVENIVHQFFYAFRRQPAQGARDPSAAL